MPSESAAAVSAGSVLEIGLLGPLRLHVDGWHIPVTSGRVRTVLAVLLVAAGQAVPPGRLAAAVWDDDPPPSAAATLRNHVKRLRQLLGPAAGRLVTTAAGYRFDTGVGELDVAEFHRLHDDAGDAVRAGDWALAGDLSGRALHLWRGPALADVAGPTLHRDEVPRLDRMRLQALEWQVDARLRAGNDCRVTELLYRLVAEHPLHERFHAQLMRALADAGRRAEALDAYRAAHRALVDELGIEPGPELQALQRRILRASEPEPGATASNQPGTPLVAGRSSAPAVVLAVPAAAELASAPPPRQLPATVRHFTGRDAECAELAKRLDETETAGTGLIIAVDGMAGVGKTALAVHWAHSVADRFPDGQLYLNLRGFDPTGSPMTTPAALRAVLNAFGVPDNSVPVDADARAGLYRSLLADRRVLVVLDNALDANHVRPLLPGGARCAVVVTSRTELTGLVAGEGAYRLGLGLLDADEARALLAAHLGAGLVNREPAATADLVDRCARLPLALTVAAARAASHPDFPLAVLAAEVRDAGRRLDALDAGDQATAVRAVFSWSYRRLSVRTAAVFRLAGLSPGPDLTAPAAASLAALPGSAATRALRELARAHLATEAAPGRYQLHDLIRVYALEQGERTDSDEVRRAAATRILDYYVYTAHAAALLIDPARQSPPLPPRPPGVVAEEPTTVADALAWLEAERAVLVAAVDAAARAGLAEHASRLPWELAPFFDRRGDWHDYDATQRVALLVATDRDDLSGQARVHRHLGRARFAVGAFDEAEAHLMQALRLYERLDVVPAQAGVHQDLARVRQPHDAAAALRHARRAYELYETLGYAPGQALALNRIGWCHALTGAARESILFHARAMCMQHGLGNRYAVALAWEGLGYAYHALLRYQAAAAYYRRAIEVFAEFQDRYNEGTTLGRLGDTSLAAGDATGARDAWGRAFAILSEMHHPEAADVRAKLAAL
jgi:DNA-binding SARP family transcriptional activator/tetratricopeptide (TPR) repeat protein